MSCKNRHIQILKYHGGELSDLEVESLREHLDKCDDCRSLESEFRRVAVFLQASPDPTVPQFLHRRIINRVAEQMNSEQDAGFLGGLYQALSGIRPVAATGIAVSAVFLGILLGSGLFANINSEIQHRRNDLVSLTFPVVYHDSSTVESFFLDKETGR